MNTNLEQIFNLLKKTLDSYYPISDNTWNEFKNICTVRELKKNEYAFDVYDKVNAISFVYKGLFRTFSFNEKGEEYTKNFFWETRIYGPMVAMLNNKPLSSIVQAIEDSIVVDIQHDKYRELLEKYDDLKMYHILYLEKHWILQKDESGYSLVLEDAKQRYKRFKEEFGHIISRLPQYHIASYLGISPTHLSRIRKSLKEEN
ncbi:Crp/Fnr family transcriptional regulator [Halarcobacter anaerophilus]|uniref:Cyclic nucleotide-binding protein n=1 Tax=Halarcobacter anaerophilus TaxID=877500 RepID=A0A4Q0XW90_9BACT|nr:Crp/Fnr family transcriptional regulator [Halarcobacter anaerophilus]QDF28791.1 transcriptional regulator, Crp/Fnr family [Halarcobacter anaerophilus]RXJ61847.1 cyclic nucleotide-binding protein [Halarcobacter anaerophilus]